MNDGFWCVFHFFEFRKLPEGNRKSYRKRYRQFFCFAAVPEASGSFPEGLPEAYWVLNFYVGSGSFRKVSGSVTGREIRTCYFNQFSVTWGKQPNLGLIWV